MPEEFEKFIEATAEMFKHLNRRISRLEERMALAQKALESLHGVVSDLVNLGEKSDV